MTYFLDDATSLFKQNTLGDNVFDQPESFLSTPPIMATVPSLMSPSMNNEICELAWEMREKGNGNWNDFYISFASAVIQRWGTAALKESDNRDKSPAEVLR